MDIGVYILHCASQKYYVGSTNNIGRRLREHGQGLVMATRNIMPVKLVYSKKCDKVSEARRLEYVIKKKKSRKIIEAIIQDQEIKFLRQ